MKKISLVNKRADTPMVAPMELLRVIRTKLGLNPWNMAKLLGKTVQSYLSLERKSNKISLQDLILLHEKSGVSLEEFWSLVKKSAEKSKSRKLKQDT